MQSAFAPVALPEGDALYLTGGPEACLVDLVEGFPSAGGECGGEGGEVEFLAFACRAQQTEFEALQAATAPFGLVLQSPYVTEPGLMVVVIVDDGEAELMGITRYLILADEVFLLRIDVGVAIVDYRLVVVCQHPLYYCGRAGSTAAMEKKFN